MFPLYLQYLLIDFRQTFVTGGSWDTDDLITFLGQKVKVQGHTIAAEAHSTRRYRRATFSSLFLAVVCKLACIYTSVFVFFCVSVTDDLLRAWVYECSDDHLTVPVIVYFIYWSDNYIKIMVLRTCSDCKDSTGLLLLMIRTIKHGQHFQN